MYEAMGLADEGKARELFHSGKWVSNRNGGKVYKMANKWVVNASGGLESKGHPIGATGNVSRKTYHLSRVLQIFEDTLTVFTRALRAFFVLKIYV